MKTIYYFFILSLLILTGVFCGFLIIIFNTPTLLPTQAPPLLDQQKLEKLEKISSPLQYSPSISTTPSESTGGRENPFAPF